MTHAAAIAALVVSAGLARTAEPVHVIPFEFDENTIWLQATVNGKGPFPFIFRTGGAGCLVDRDVAARIGLKVVDWYPGGWAGALGSGKPRFGSVPDATVEIGPVRLDRPFVAAVSFEGARESWGRPLYGAIGSSLFEKYVVAVDYAGRELRLYDPVSYEYSGRGYSWPLRIRDKVPYIVASFVIPGRPAEEAVFLLHTGQQDGVLFARGYAARHGLEEALRTAGRRVLSVPVAGDESGWSVARIDTFSVGPFAIHEPLVGIPTAGSTASTPAAGAIGTELLRRFTVIFDYRRERIILEPNQGLNEFERYDASGITLRYEGEPRTVTVWKVLPGSPAKEAGIKPGDRIVRIDDVTTPTLWAVRDALMADGHTVRVGIQRAGRRRDFALSIRRLL